MVTSSALRFDAAQTPASKIYMSVGWLTSPVRRLVSRKKEEIVSITVVNAAQVKWNLEQADRIEELKGLNPRIAGRACASMLYDGIKSAIPLDSYGPLRNKLAVYPADESGYTNLNKNSFYINEEEPNIDTETKKYDNKTINAIINEFKNFEDSLNDWAVNGAEVEEQINFILEKAVHPRLTSTFIEACFIHADMDMLKSEIASIKSDVSSVRDDISILNKKAEPIGDIASSLKAISADISAIKENIKSEPQP